eukprot:SAG25_NODE_320_length_9927_cov_18.459402_1_plen_22_part_10
MWLSRGSEAWVQFEVGHYSYVL